MTRVRYINLPQDHAKQFWAGLPIFGQTKTFWHGSKNSEKSNLTLPLLISTGFLKYTLEVKKKFS